MQSNKAIDEEFRNSLSKQKTKYVAAIMNYIH
jgi:hypothetical protein